MEEKSLYKRCFVPQCPNTQKKYPNKIFICVPRDIKMRKAWFRAAHRSDADASNLKSNIHCCEDHFNVIIILFYS